MSQSSRNSAAGSDDPRRRTPSPVPLIELWGLLLLPLHGDVSDSQMDQAGAAVLGEIRQRPVEGLVVDVSGVWMVDSHLCALLARLTTAARLMGVPSVLCGLGPEVVQTLQAMDFDLRGIRTALGLEAALELLGIRGRSREGGRRWIAGPP
jgi:rsbT antagonist protein RsbS